MNPIRIIGIGSPFGDDSIAWDAIDAIERSRLLARFPHGMVDTFCCGSPGGGLLPLLSGASAAILIDASRTGAPVGTVQKIDVRELQNETGQVSAHDLSVADTLALGSALHMLPPALIIYGVEIGEGSAAPGPTLLAALPVLLRAIEKELRILVHVHERQSAKEVNHARAFPASPRS